LIYLKQRKLSNVPICLLPGKYMHDTDSEKQTEGTKRQETI